MEKVERDIEAVNEFLDRFGDKTSKHPSPLKLGDIIKCVGCPPDEEDLYGYPVGKTFRVEQDCYLNFCFVDVETNDRSYYGLNCDGHTCCWRSARFELVTDPAKVKRGIDVVNKFLRRGGDKTLRHSSLLKVGDVIKCIGCHPNVKDIYRNPAGKIFRVEEGFLRRRFRIANDEPDVWAPLCWSRVAFELVTDSAEALDKPPAEAEQDIEAVNRSLAVNEFLSDVSFESDKDWGYKPTSLLKSGDLVKCIRFSPYERDFYGKPIGKIFRVEDHEYDSNRFCLVEFETNRVEKNRGIWSAGRFELVTEPTN